MMQKIRMKMVAPLTALFTLCFLTTPAIAQTNAHSSPDDRRRFVTIVQSLERTPFDPRLRSDRAWAVQWLTDAPDVSVTVCADPLGGMPEKTFAPGPEIIVQYMLAMAAFILENPGKLNDPDAQQLAGVESALTTYRSMRTVRPNLVSPNLDKLLEIQSRGELPSFVRKAYLQCVKKGAKGGS